MKKFIIPILLFLGLPLWAQESSDATVKRTDIGAWYIGANVGAHIFNGVNDSEMSFGDRISAIGSIYGGRWMNDWFALEGSLSFAQFRGVYAGEMGDKHFTTEDVYKVFNGGHFRWQKGCYANFNINAKFDLNTVFYGYIPERHNHFMPHLGAGIATGLGSGNSKVVPVLALGLQYQYAFNPQWAFTADFDSHWLGEKLDNENCPDNHTFHNSYGLTVGVVYTFKK